MHRLGTYNMGEHAGQEGEWYITVCTVIALHIMHRWHSRAYRPQCDTSQVGYLSVLCFLPHQLILVQPKQAKRRLNAEASAALLIHVIHQVRPVKQLDRCAKAEHGLILEGIVHRAAGAASLAYLGSRLLLRPPKLLQPHLCKTVVMNNDDNNGDNNDRSKNQHKQY